MKFVVKTRSSPVSIEGLLLGAFPALRAFFRHRLPAERRGEAEDFAQETLLAAWQALMRESGAVVENPSRYLVGIARYKCLDALRRRGDPKVHYPTTSEGEEFAADLGEVAADNLVLCAEIRRRLAKALSKLPDNERQLLYLCFFEEVRHREVARTLGIAPEAASRLKYRALDRLRFLLRSMKTGRLT